MLVVPDSLRPHGLQSSRLFCPWYFPGKHTGVGCHCLLQGTFPTQGSNQGLLHCRWSLALQAFFTNWATRKAVCVCVYVFFSSHLTPVKFECILWTQARQKSWHSGHYPDIHKFGHSWLHYNYFSSRVTCIYGTTTELNCHLQCLIRQYSDLTLKEKVHV